MPCFIDWMLVRFMKRPRLRYLSLFVFVLILGSGIALGATIQSSFGEVAVAEVDFAAADSSNIHATLQRPTYATDSNPLPGVVVIHGSLQSKEWLMSFGIELSRRGYVVLTIDANGHGNSDDGTGAGAAALEYIADLSYVNSSSLGLVGHSMGGGISWRAINQSEVSVRALVLVGSWVRADANTTFPSNLLITVGDFDSLFNYQDNLDVLSDVFGVSDVEEGTTYGSFKDGTARRVVISRTNHLFETIDPEIVSETTQWMQNSLKGGVEDEHWIDSNQLIYGWWLVGGFIATSGLVLTIFPLITILLSTQLFNDLRDRPATEHSVSKKEYFGFGIIYGLISIGTFYPLLGLGAFIPFPQSYGPSISLWILGSALISLLVLRKILMRKNREELSWGKLWRLDTEEASSKIKLMKFFVLAVLVVVWLYAWTLLVDLGLALDFRCFLPGMNDLTVSRSLFVPIYSIVFSIYFLIEGMWFVGLLRPRNSEPWYKGQLIWSSSAVFMKCIPYVILISIELGIGLLTGVAVIPGIIGYSFLFFYAFLPWFAVGTIINVWSYRETNNYYLGALINGLFFGWIIATILAF